MYNTTYCTYHEFRGILIAHVSITSHQPYEEPLSPESLFPRICLSEKICITVDLRGPRGLILEIAVAQEGVALGFVRHSGLQRLKQDPMGSYTLSTSNR
jgi:hypothetical protein